MSVETETVTGNPEAQQQNADTQKEETAVGASEVSSQPSVQEEACILKQNVQAEAGSPSAARSPKSPVAEATEDFLLNEKGAYETPEPQPRTPLNSEASEEQQESAAAQVVEVSVYSETTTVIEAVADEPPAALINGLSTEEPLKEPAEPEPEPQILLSNGQSNGECKFEPRKTVEPVPELESTNDDNKPQILNGTIANELATEDYKLPDVVEVKKNFEYVEPSGQNFAQAPPKKGALSTNIDSPGVKQAYQDVRHDGSETQWAVFKFEGPTIITKATGEDFAQFKKEFGDDERAFGYIRVQTGDEMSRRAKFLLVTWVGPAVSVLKRAKMSTDKALIKDIVSNFAVELQTENISDIDLKNFETELDKASGAHYGTGVRS